MCATALEADIDIAAAGQRRRSGPGCRGRAARPTGAGEFVVVDGSTVRARTARTAAMVRRTTAAMPATTCRRTPNTLRCIETPIAKGAAVLDAGRAFPCGDGTCYHVTAALDREASWQLIVRRSSGRRRVRRRLAATEIVARRGRARHLRRPEDAITRRGSPARSRIARAPRSRSRVGVLEPRPPDPDRAAAAGARRPNADGGFQVAVLDRSQPSRRSSGRLTRALVHDSGGRTDCPC